MTIHTTHLTDTTSTTPRSRCRVLLVEDDDMVREALAMLLADDLEVDTAASAEAALAGFVAGRYDVLLTDLGLPGRKGNELRRALQEVDPGLSAVLMTADDLRPGDPRIAGFEGWWQKPFLDMRGLLGAVATAARDSRRRRAG